MKNLSLFIIIISCNICFGQGIKFQLYLTKACSTVEKLDTTYYLYKVPGNMDTAFIPKAGITYLPSKGRYMIGFDNGPILDSPFIEINDTSLVIFRLKENKIALYEGGLDSPPVYESCGILLNGYGEDFYPNGNVRIRGNFKNGRPKDSLVTFYQNGKVKKRTIHLLKETFITEFDSLSHLAKTSAYEKGNYQKNGFYNQKFKITEFFNNGRIKLNEAHFGRLVLIKELYPSGQLKIMQTRKKRVEYYDNGTISSSYTWKYPREKDLGYSLKVQKRQYDKNGQILLTATYEFWNNSDTKPEVELDIDKSDWIESVKQYEGGKVVFAEKDLETKMYGKKN
jgi:antitoxin component YwqK of YwqJK toxin-antitoxin module